MGTVGGGRVAVRQEVVNHVRAMEDITFKQERNQ